MPTSGRILIGGVDISRYDTMEYQGFFSDSFRLFFKNSSYFHSC